MTPSDYFKLVVEKKIDPHEQRDIHLVGKYLGSGSQFDVYGHQYVIEPGFLSFDDPYISTRSKASETGNFYYKTPHIQTPFRRSQHRVFRSGFWDTKPTACLGAGGPCSL